MFTHGPLDRGRRHADGRESVPSVSPGERARQAAFMDVLGLVGDLAGEAGPGRRDTAGVAAGLAATGLVRHVVGSAARQMSGGSARSRACH